MLLSSAALLVGACAPAPTSPDPSAATATASAAVAPGASAGTVRIGVSSTVGDTGWGAAFRCSIQAEAGLAGDVELTVRDRPTDTAGQAEDLRNLAAIGVEAIVVRPVDPAGLTTVVKDLVDAGVVVISVGQPIADTGADFITVDQIANGTRGASWLFDTIGDKGRVIAISGPADDPVQAERKSGFDQALAAHEDVKVEATIDTKGDPAVAVKELNTLLTANTKFDGIWASGVDSYLVDALRIAGHEQVPIVGSDNGAFVSQLLTVVGLEGAAVTDSPAIGGAAIRRALDALDPTGLPGPAAAFAPRLWDNTSEAGRAQLNKANDPAIEEGWPLDLSIEGQTEATTEEVVACGAPPG